MNTQNNTLPLLRSVVSCRVIRPGPDTDVRYGPDRSRCDGTDDMDFFKSLNQSGSDICSLSISEPEANNDFELGKVHVSGSSIDGTDQLDIPSSWPLTPQAEDILGGPRSGSTNQPCSRILVWENIWVPSLLIQGSMILLLVTLTVVISSCTVKSIRGPLSEPNGSSQLEQQKNLLLNIQANWLTFIFARGPQIATLLAGPLMQLWTWKIAQSMIDASKLPHRNLPTPYQFSILIGLCTASVDRLRRWLSYRYIRRQRKNAPPSPPILVHAALMLALCLTLALATSAADIWITYTTTTVPYELVDASAALQALGRGLSPTCLSVDRVSNNDYPCTFSRFVSYNGYNQQQVERYLLNRNDSQTSEIRVFASENETDIAFLLQKPQTLSPYLDYRTSTIGISTQCLPITQLCNFTVSTGQYETSSFFCSPKFYGQLGSILTTTTPNPNLPPLALQINNDLILAFFTDNDLVSAYNSIGYNPITGQADPDTPALLDSQLVNEVYFAIAARFLSDPHSQNENTSKDSGIFRETQQYLNVVLKCSYKAFHVNYTWFNGTVQDFQSQPAPNGTISELWHGIQAPPPSSLFNTNRDAMQSILTQAVVQNNSSAFAQVWAQLYSISVLSTIGAVTSSRENLLQQERRPILVTQVYIFPICVFALCCILHMILGAVLANLASRTARRGDIRDARSRLKLFGVVDWAVTSAASGAPGAYSKALAEETKITEEHEMVGLSGSGSNYYLGVFAGHDH